MNLFTELTISLLALFISAGGLSAQETLFGNVINDNGDPIIGGTVTALDGDTFVTGAATDDDGNYSIELEPGSYNVKYSFVGYTSQLLDGVDIVKGKENELNMTFEFNPKSNISCGASQPNLPIDISGTTQGMILNSREIRRLSKPN